MNNGYAKAKANILKKMRPLVLERDGHRCVVCNSTERLQIAHYLPLAQRLKGEIPFWGKYYFRRVEPESWQELNSIKNLVTPCINRHRTYDARGWKMRGERRKEAKAASTKIEHRIDAYLANLYPPEPIKMEHMSQPQLCSRITSIVGGN